MRKRIGNVLWGIFFLAIGIGIAGSLLGLWVFQPFFEGWWTLFILIPCVISIVESGPRISNMIWMVIGLLLLACTRGYMDWGTMWKLLIPIVFIVIGLGMVIRSIFSVGMKRVSIPSEMKKDETLVFSGKKYVVEEEFYGMNLDAIFGGATLDLRNAKIDQNISLELTAVFGGIDVLLPDNVKAVISSNALFGGCSNGHHVTGEDLSIVYINATALFGGVEVK